MQNRHLPWTIVFIFSIDIDREKNVRVYDQQTFISIQTKKKEITYVLFHK
jgi:hypothetical protein